MTTVTFNKDELLKKEPVRACVYYSVMVCNSTGITYLIYLYTNGMLG
jgi:hypothetical protein